MDDLKLYSLSQKGLDSLVQTVRVFSEDIRMEFRREDEVKCFKGIHQKVKKRFKVKFECWEFSSWTVSLLRNSAAFVSWRESELESIDRKTRRLFTIYGASHPKSDVDRLYIPKKERGRGLISIDDCVELVIRGLEVYVHGRKD